MIFYTRKKVFKNLSTHVQNNVRKFIFEMRTILQLGYTMRKRHNLIRKKISFFAVKNYTEINRKMKLHTY